MRIKAVRVTPIAFRDPPLLNVAGVHEPWALRSIIEVELDNGMIGLGESYGDSATLRDLEAVRVRLTGLDPFDLNGLETRAYAALANSGDSGGDGDFDIVAQRRKEVHQALDGKCSGLAAHEAGDVRLLDAENFPGLRLRELAFLRGAIDLQHEPGLEQFLLWIGQAEIREHVAAAFGDSSRSRLDLPRSFGHD